MNLNELLKNIVPNPFSSQSTLAGVQKKGELISEGFGLAALAKNIVFLFILGFVVTGYFGVPGNIVAILVGTEILLISISGYIKIRKIRSVYAINSQDNVKDYRAILVTAEYFDLIKSIFAVIANIVSVSLVLLFFSSEISNLAAKSNPFQAGTLKYFVLIFVVFRFIDFFIKVIRYSWVKNLPESNDLALVNQAYQVIRKKLELVKFIPAMSALLLILYLFGIPFYVTVIFASFMFLFLVLSVIELQRVKAVDFNKESPDSLLGGFNKLLNVQAPYDTIANIADEKIIFSVFGVIKTASGFKDIFKPLATSILGSGKTLYPENTLLVTNHRLLLIQIPLTGGDKIVGEADYVTTNFFYNRAELRQRGEEILKTNSLSQLLNLAKRSIGYEEIKILELRQTQATIKKLNGEKLSYIFMDREYLDSLKASLQSCLKDRFIEIQ